MADSKKLQERTIRHAAFEYHEEIPNPLKPGEKMLRPRIARQGETVKLMPHDIERGEEHGAFLGDTPEEQHYLRFLKGQEDTPLPEQQATAAPENGGVLADWVVGAKASDIVAKLQGDPERAAEALAAEQGRSDGEPRKSVVEGLQQIIDQGPGPKVGVSAAGDPYPDDLAKAQAEAIKQQEADSAALAQAQAGPTHPRPSAERSQASRK